MDVTGRGKGSIRPISFQCAGNRCHCHGQIILGTRGWTTMRGGGEMAGGTAPPVGDQLGPSLVTTHLKYLHTPHLPANFPPVLVFSLPSIRCLLPPRSYPLSSFKNLHLPFSAQPHAQQPIHRVLLLLLCCNLHNTRSAFKWSAQCQNGWHTLRWISQGNYLDKGQTLFVALYWIRQIEGIYFKSLLVKSSRTSRVPC